MTAPRSRASLAASLALAAAILAIPNSARAQKVVAPGFQSELVYAVPDVEHPSVVTCDDAGNLFVGEDPMDMRGPTREAIDRVLLIKWDANGKPQKTVFCDKLAAVFGLVWRDGWLYVLHAPHYSRFKDHDGDGVADVREDLADGFGPPAGIYGFNDHIVTGTRLGLDGLIYISVGDKGVPKATGADGSTLTLEGGGVIRMRPDGSQLEIFSSGTRNHLDVAMNSLDDVFTYDNTDDGLGWWTRFTHHVPTGYYGYPYDYHPHRDRHLPRISEHGGGSPVGAACYREAAWPAKYRDAAFMCDWGKRKIQVFHPKKSGATYTAEMEDFMVPEDGSEFRPQDVCFSPDGRDMYVADWNYGGWVNPLRAGRLYRVRYVGGEGLEKVAPEPQRHSNDEPVAAQIESLAHPAHSERMRAQDQLVKLGGSSVEPLKKLLADKNSAELARVHAIWAQNGLVETLRGFDPTAEWTAALANDPSAAVRAQAARAIGLRKLKEGRAALAAALRDADASVRLHAAVGLGRIGDPASAGVLFAALNEQDEFARFAIVQALRAINAWDDAGKALAAPDESIRAATRLALTGQYSAGAVAALAEATQKAPTPAEKAAAVEALAEVHRKADPYTGGWWGTRPAANKPARPKAHEWTGTPVVLKAVATALESGDEPVRLAAVKAEIEVRDPQAFGALRAIAEKDASAAVRTAAIEALGAVKDPEAVALLAKVAGDDAAAENVRRAAINAVAAIGSPAAVGKLVEVASAKGSSATLVALSLDALGKLKAKDGAAAAESRLADADANVRKSAVAALAAIAGEKSVARLTPLLKDSSADVKKAVLAELATLKSGDSVPDLLDAANDAAIRFDVQQTLSAIPDPRALPLYLDGLTSKNNELRTACREALVVIRDRVADDVVKLHEANELSTAMRTELQTVFSAPAPISTWRYVGPFTKDKLPTLDWTAAPDFQANYSSGDQTVSWKTTETKDENGRVNAGRLVRPSDGVWLIAYAAIESESDMQAPIVVGSDDMMIVYVNGEKIYEFQGNRGWNADQGRGVAKLKKGVNHLYALVGNASGPYEFSARVSRREPKFAFLFDATPAKLDPAVYAQFAMKNKGDAAKGKAIFDNTQGVGCVKCHAVQGVGSKIGPDLVGIGVKYPKEELIRSTLEPSSRILNGYETTIVTTVEGKTISGLLKRETAEELELTLADGKAVIVRVADVEDRELARVSLMPNGLKDGLTLEEFADLIAYLESLKEGAPPK